MIYEITSNERILFTLKMFIEHFRSRQGLQINQNSRNEIR